MKTINTYQPWSQEAEQTVIGSVLTRPSMLADLTDIIAPEDFYGAQHIMYFEAIMAVSEKSAIDLITVFAHCEEFLGATREDFTYLTEITLEGVSYNNVIDYAKIVKGKSKEREVIQSFRDGHAALIDEDAGSSEERINNALAPVSALNFDEDKTETFEDGIKAVIKQLEVRLTQTEVITGLKTGLDELDQATCGLQNTDLIILGARPSMGKTTLAMNIAAAASLGATEGVTLVFSMEMSQQQLQQRLIAAEGGVRLHAIQRPKELFDYEWEGVGRATKKMLEARMVVDDRPGLNPVQMRGKCIREQRKNGKINLIVVDYLQLMTVAGKSEGRVMDITRISAALKGFAKEFNCPVLALSQLNRSLEQRPDKRPIMSDLRDSGAIEQDADIIMFLYRDEVYNPQSEHEGYAELNLAKFRAGQLTTIPLRSDLGKGRFRDMNGESLPEITQHKNNRSREAFNG